MDKWNLFDAEITKQEKQELSDYLFEFKDEYENDSMNISAKKKQKNLYTGIRD